MKSDLQELIDTAKKLSDRLDEIARQDREFSVNLQIEFERMSWEAIRWMDDLKAIKQYVG